MMSTSFEIVPNKLDGYHFVMRLPVQFGDVDGMGHMNNVAYLAFVETVRLEYFVRLLNLQDTFNPLNQMPFILGSQNITYRTPAFYRETLLVGVRSSWIKRSSFGFEFAMHDEVSQRLVAEGGGTHVMFNYETGRSMPVPDDWIALMEGFEAKSLKQV